MGALTDWATKNSPFLKVPDNGEMVVTYQGFKEVDDTRNPGKTKIRYICLLDGEQKWFESAASSVAIFFDSCEEGDNVRIKKIIEGKKTFYEVEMEVTKEETKEDKEMNKTLDKIK
jgi:hypothetical protein